MDTYETSQLCAEQITGIQMPLNPNTFCASYMPPTSMIVQQPNQNIDAFSNDQREIYNNEYKTLVSIHDYTYDASFDDQRKGEVSSIKIKTKETQISKHARTLRTQCHLKRKAVVNRKYNKANL